MAIGKSWRFQPTKLTKAWSVYLCLESATICKVEQRSLFLAVSIQFSLMVFVCQMPPHGRIVPGRVITEFRVKFATAKPLNMKMVLD